MYVCMYVCMCICVCMCVYIYIYINMFLFSFSGYLFLKSCQQHNCFSGHLLVTHYTRARLLFLLPSFFRRSSTNKITAFANNGGLFGECHVFVTRYTTRRPPSRAKARDAVSAVFSPGRDYFLLLLLLLLIHICIYIYIYIYIYIPNISK